MSSDSRWIQGEVKRAIARGQIAHAVGLVTGYGERLAERQKIPPGLAVRTAGVLDEALEHSTVSPSMIENTLREFHRVQA